MNKDKAREMALAAIKKKLGVSLPTAAEFEEPDVPVIPTGCLSLDLKLGTGGYPRGRIIEIYGPNASGKTTLTLHAIANAQKLGGNCAFVDAECALDLDYAADLGVDLDTLVYHRPDSGEEALEAVETLASSTGFDLIVIDSVSSLVPQREVEGGMGDSHVGLQARLMGQALRKLTPVTSKSGTTIIFLNQTRSKVGVMFGSSETTSGGNSLGFYASLRLRVARTGSLKVGDEVIGNKTQVKIIKNKLAGTARHECSFKMYANNEHGCGISLADDVLEQSLKLGFIQKSGAWYKYEGETIGQGSTSAAKYLRDHPDLMEQLRRDIILQSSVKQRVKDKLLGDTDG